MKHPFDPSFLIEKGKGEVFDLQIPWINSFSFLKKICMLSEHLKYGGIFIDFIILYNKSNMLYQQMSEAEQRRPCEGQIRHTNNCKSNSPYFQTAVHIATAQRYNLQLLSFCERLPLGPRDQPSSPYQYLFFSYPDHDLLAILRQPLFRLSSIP
jgi:hypothetical protein